MLPPPFQLPQNQTRLPREQSAQTRISPFLQSNWNKRDILLLTESFPPYKKEQWVPRARVATTIPESAKFTYACIFDTHVKLSCFWWISTLFVFWIYFLAVKDFAPRPLSFLLHFPHKSRILGRYALVLPISQPNLVPGRYQSGMKGPLCLLKRKSWRNDNFQENSLNLQAIDVTAPGQLHRFHIFPRNVSLWRRERELFASSDSSPFGICLRNGKPRNCRFSVRRPESMFPIWRRKENSHCPNLVTERKPNDRQVALVRHLWKRYGIQVNA